MPNELSIIVDAILNPDSLNQIKNEIDSISKGKSAQLSITAVTTEAKKKVDELKQSLANSPARIVIDVNKGVSQSNISSFISNIKNNTVKNPIKLTLGVNQSASLKNFKDAISNIQNALGKKPIQIPVAPTQQPRQQNNNQNTKNTNPPSFGNGNGIPYGTGSDYQKYFAELNKAIDKYQTTAFNDINANASNIRIIHDELEDSYKATVDFNNALGETTQVMFKLETSADGLTQNWVATGEKFTMSFKDAGKDIEKTLDTLQTFQSKLDIVKSKAFDRTNKLTGNFAQPVEDEIKRIQDSITSLKDNANNNGIAITAQQVRDLRKEMEDLDNLRIKQQNTQFQARQLSATDITQQIPILKNDVTTLENGLKNMGFGQKFQSQIDDLRDLIKTLGQPGGATVQQYNSQMKQLKSDITRYESTVRGRGDIAANSIATNQLQNITGINKILNAQANTEGIQRARTELAALADEYKKLQAQLQSGKLSNARLGTIERETKELDQQLHTFQALAKNLNGDASSQQWVSTQETGIQKLKVSFTEYQDAISKTIQLTPDLQSKLDALSETMNRPGAIDVTNWKEAQNTFEQLKVSIGEFQNSVQGQASQLSIDINTNKLQEAQAVLDKLNNTTVQSSGVQSVRTELEGLIGQYQQLMAQLQNPNLGEDEFKKLAQSAKELDDRLKVLSKQSSDTALVKYQASAEKLELQFERLKKKYEQFLQTKPNGGSEELEERFARVREELDKITPDNIQAVSKEMTTLGSAVSNVVGPTQTLSQALRESLGGVGGYLARFTSAAVIIQKTISVIKSMVTEVKNLDTSLVELQKVTDLTGNALNKFTDEAYKIGETLGRTGQDVIDAVTTFSRAGYDLKEATDLAQAALVMTNVGPDIASTESAASDMISILKAYKVEAKDAMGIIDELYNVSNKEPLDFSNITQMLVTAGGTLAQTGTTIEESMGLLTGAFATMRDESVSNG